MKQYLAPLTLALLLPAVPAKAASDPYVGEIMWVGFNFCPRGWAEANGSELSIASNTALFSLLGTQFGGNGQTTFALPDLRGRAAVGSGSGPGLSNIQIGQQSGAEVVTLTQVQMPQHTHALPAPVATAEPGNTENPVGSYIANGQRAAIYRNATDTLTTEAMATGGATTAISGGSQPVSVRDPYLGLTACIALQGIFPSRN